jgi:hypothetical protein
MTEVVFLFAVLMLLCFPKSFFFFVLSFLAPEREGFCFSQVQYGCIKLLPFFYPLFLHMSFAR